MKQISAIQKIQFAVVIVLVLVIGVVVGFRLDKDTAPKSCTDALRYSDKIISLAGDAIRATSRFDASEVESIYDEMGLLGPKYRSNLDECKAAK